MNPKKVFFSILRLNTQPCLASRKASSSESVKSTTESVKSTTESVKSDKSDKSDKSGLSRANSIQAESVKGDETASEPVSEPTVQEEDVGDTSQASGSVAGDNTAGDEIDGDGAADEPTVSLKKLTYYYPIFDEITGSNRIPNPIDRFRTMSRNQMRNLKELLKMIHWMKQLIQANQLVQMNQELLNPRKRLMLSLRLTPTQNTKQDYWKCTFI